MSSSSPGLVFSPLKYSISSTHYIVAETMFLTLLEEGFSLGLGGRVSHEIYRGDEVGFLQTKGPER